MVDCDEINMDGEPITNPQEAWEQSFSASFNMLSEVVNSDARAKGFLDEPECVARAREALAKLDDDPESKFPRAHFDSIEVALDAAGTRDPARTIALMHSELSEALEAMRKGDPASQKIPGFTNLEEELADTVIRIMDFNTEHGLDVGNAIIAKLAYNRSRPYKHGKKF